MRRVAVTGLGLVTPVGNNVEESWKAAVEGRTGVDRIRAFDPADLSVQIAAEVSGLRVDHVFDAKEVKRATRFIQFAGVAAHEAMADAGLDSKSEDTARWGCTIGAGMGALADIEINAHVLKEKGPRRVSPFFMPYSIPNMATGIVSRLFNLQGPNICTSTACTSGTHGVGEGFLLIGSDMADVIIAGGAESAICPLGIAAFAAMKALSTHNENPLEASRPFDKHRDGFIMGEGSGVVVLEELERAKKRGATIYAEVVGYGMSADAYHITAPSPGGEGARRCMALALATGKIPASQVDYINAHGTSTNLNDKYESAAIARVFGEHANDMAISSTKGVTGHTLGAAGGIEAVFTALALHRSIVPPTAGLKTPDPDCPLDYTPGAYRERKIRYALSNSFGFGGTNGSIILKRF